MNLTIVLTCCTAAVSRCAGAVRRTRHALRILRCSCANGHSCGKTRGRHSMRHLLKASLVVCALAPALALPATAQQEPAAVPVEKAAYHWPVFRNGHVMALRVYFPPGRGSNYHIHSTDQ